MSHMQPDLISGGLTSQSIAWQHWNDKVSYFEWVVYWCWPKPVTWRGARFLQPSACMSIAGFPWEPKWPGQVLQVCATPSVDDESLILIILFKTGGNSDWFTRKHQGSKNSEQNKFKHQSHFGGKTPTERPSLNPEPSCCQGSYTLGQRSRVGTCQSRQRESMALVSVVWTAASELLRTCWRFFGWFIM